jgi:hypothetical protein
MPECRCRTNFFPAFRIYCAYDCQHHKANLTPSAAVYIIDVQGLPLSSFVQFLKMPECRTVRHPVSPVTDWKRMPMPRPVRYRKKGPIPVSEWPVADRVVRYWNADAGGISLDTDAQLWYVVNANCSDAYTYVDVALARSYAIARKNKHRSEMFIRIKCTHTQL